MNATDSVLSVERRDGVLCLTKTDEARSNGISLAMAKALHAGIAAAHDDDTIRALLIDAAGRGFHGSAVMVTELKTELAELTNVDFAQIETVGQDLGRALAALEKPVIGIARAGALGGGLELLLRCDFLYCLDSARFKLPEVLFGFVAAWGGTQWASRMMTYRRAQEMLLLGETLDGRAAETSGLVTRSFADDDALDTHVASVIQQLRHCSPSAFRNTKHALRAAWNGPLAEGERAEYGAQLAALAAGDFLNGLEAARQGGHYDYVAGVVRPKT